MSDASDRAEDAPVPTDRELIETMKSAGSSTFLELYRRHAPAVHSFIQTGIANSTDADDVFQEVFATAWQKLDADQMPGESALPWLLVTGRNLTANLNRKKSRHSTIALENADVEGIDNAFESGVSAEESLAVRVALAKLSPIDRKIVDLCLQQNMLYKEAARATNDSVGAIRNRLSRARKFLRGELASVRGEEHEQ